MVCLLASSLLYTGSCRADTNQVTEKSSQLDTLRSRINKLQQSRMAAQHKKSRALEAMRAVETRISQTLMSLKRLETQIKEQQHSLNKLQAVRVSQSTLAGKQRQQLTREIQSAYAMGRQQPVKLLLNQEESARLGRMLAYYGYFSRARTGTITAVRQRLTEIAKTEAAISDRLQGLATLQHQAMAERDRYDQQLQQRKLVVSQLSKEVNAQGGRLSQLAADEKRLADVVKSLRQALADIPVKRQQASFRSRKGALLWPARGALNNVFGTKLPGTDINADGVLIRAPEGGSVSSIAQGRVAFADWIRGYGLLMIIDHGDGYMSLYGYNQVLYKEVGEWVDTGEVIAALGRSGGQATPALYFELRFRGQPVDPGRWCRGKPAAVKG